jgi:CRP-like cAMP-binding protein
MDLQLLFTAERLQLNRLLTKGAVKKGRFTLKTLDIGGYLTVDELQWEVLSAFAQPKTVPEILRNLIVERKCPALRDFYELIIKAQRSGVLQTAPNPDKQLVPVVWRLSLSFGVACWLGAALLVSGLVAIAIWPPRLPSGTWSEIMLAILAGYFGVAAAVSLGNVLGVSVLHAAGRDAFRPQFSWSWLLPHFNIDLRDWILVETPAQLGIHLMRLAPLGLLVTAVCIWWPQAALLPVIVLGLQLRPCFGGAISQAINASFGKPVLDTCRHLLFPANWNWGGLWRAARLQFDRPVVVARLVWGLLWIGGMTILSIRAAGVAVSDLILDWHFWKVFAVVFAIALAIPVGVMICIAAVESVRQPLRMVKKRQRTRQLRKQAVHQPVTMKTITSTLAISPVCQQLPVDRRQALAEQVTVAIIQRGTILANFNQPASEIYLIVSGAVNVYRRTQKGRVLRVWQAIEGDIVGAEEMVDPDSLGWRLKARSPVVALRLPREVFENEIIARLGPALVQALIHRVPFLRQNHLCRNWHPQAISRFATISRVVKFSAGSYVLIEDHYSQALFFIYEGQAQVVRHKRRISRLGHGDFIGEIGLMQNSSSTASVIAEGPLSCLAIDKMVFFRFLSQNYEVGLEVERMSSQRLGKPVFPLATSSFEIR